MKWNASDQIKAKKQRAEEHFGELQSEVSTYSALKPVEMISKFDETAKVHTLHARVRIPPPIRIPLIAGEVIGCLRHTLDYLAWHLASLDGGKPDTSTQFPIFAEAAEYEREKGGKKKVKRIPATPRALIESLQPFKSSTPFDHPLYLLNQWANVDKHRTLTVVTSTPTGIGGKFFKGVESYEAKIIDFNEEFQEFGKVTYFQGVTDYQYDALLNTSLCLRTDKPPHKLYPIIPVVNGLVRVVGETLEKFSAYLDR